MPNWTRRDLLKSGLATWLGAWLPVPRWLRGLASTSASTQDVPPRPRSPGGPASTGTAVAPPDGSSPRERLLLDFGWRFAPGNADDPARDFGYGRPAGEGEFAKSGELFRRGPSRMDFDDSGWQAIDLPHDWAVDLPFVADRALIGHGAKPLGRIYPATSIGWYRRVFEIPASDAGRRLSIRFDGAFRNCMVALNGFLLGRHASGYAPFRYDVTDVAEYGGRNVLVVRVDATEYEGWFYEGAGIYRHVWLEKTSPVHVAHEGTLVVAELPPGPLASLASARLRVTTELDNEGDEAASAVVAHTVLDPAGHAVASSSPATVAVPAHGRHTAAARIEVPRPELWSIETPRLYRLITTVAVAGAATDRTETAFGIRSITADPDRGLLLNGRHVEVKGTCNHQDHAGVGTALPDRLQAYRVERLKAMGCNAYRTSHNPPTPELLDACDRLGMLVMDETRTFASSPGALAQLEAMVRRDRNHPSVVWWSIGNEEPAQGTERGERIAAVMKRHVLRLDPSRPVTMAMNNGWGHGASAVLDVQGFNYGHGPDYDAFHRQFPRQPTMGSETASTVSTRGIYANDPSLGYVSAYDVNKPPWGNTAEGWWRDYSARPFLAGGFVWTGFDYRGEPTPYAWPCISSHFGLMDTCGFPKDNFYYYQAWWTDRPVLHLFPHWNWAGREGRPIDVWCYSNLDRVELRLNGHSLGSKTVPRPGHVQWSVPYHPGVLEARGYKRGRRVLTVRRETTGAPAALRLEADRAAIDADGEDAVVVRVAVLDRRGRVVPTADDEVAFDVAGPGRLIGVGNGNPSSHEPDHADRRRAFNGLCAAIVQATKASGELRVTATARGLKADVAAVQCRPVTPRPAVP